MAFVLDCSTTMAWIFPDEATEATDRLLQSLAEEQAFAPALWPVDVANAFLVAIRRGRVEADEWPWVRHVLETLPIVIDPVDGPRVWSPVVDLGRANGISIYDAMYLELALRMRLPLATLDHGLARAAQAVDVDVLAYGKRAGRRRGSPATRPPLPGTPGPGTGSR